MTQTLKKQAVDSFLVRCDPRTKLLAFFCLMPLLLTKSLTTPGGWLALFWVVVAILAAGLEFSHFFRQLKRLRWLFTALVLFHALMTPGQLLWSGLFSISREGLIAGGIYSARLILMVSLAWVLVVTTTPAQIVVGFRSLFGFLAKVGVPIERSLSLLAFTLGRIPHLIHEAGQVREDMQHRLGVIANSNWRPKSWFDRLNRMALVGEALLFRLLNNAKAQEEALLVRGISNGLPPVPPVTSQPGWRDAVVFFTTGAVVVTGFLL